VQGKLATADFYFKRLLPKAEAHRASALAGAASLMEMQERAFAHC
jgi:hypothetical protein